MVERGTGGHATQLKFTPGLTNQSYSYGKRKSENTELNQKLFTFSFHHLIDCVKLSGASLQTSYIFIWIIKSRFNI